MQEQSPLGHRIEIDIPSGVTLFGPNIEADVHLLIALGNVVRAASMTDQALRGLYCALIGSPYAAITAAGQMSRQLIDWCQAVAKSRLDLTDEQKATIKGELATLISLVERRNRFVHDVWARGATGPSLIRSSKGNYELSIEPVTLDDLAATAIGLNGSSVAITNWIFETLGAEAVGLEAQLRWIQEQSRQDIE